MTANIKKIGFLLIDGFTMMAFSNVIEPLRMANYVSSQPVYSWIISGFAGHQTSASNGVQVTHTAEIKHLFDCELVFICGGYEAENLMTDALKGIVERLAVRDIALGGLCTGAIALANAGLLANQSASLHWENVTLAQEQFGNVKFLNHIFTIGDRLYTCSGGVCALDMTLHIIKQHFGREIVEKIQDMFVITAIREPASIQHLPKPKTLSHSYAHVIDAITLMKTNIEEPLTLADIAKYVGISERQLQRQFAKQLGVSPQQYYLNLRLEHAKNLLQHTTMPVTTISMATGFFNLASFSRAFQRQVNMSASDFRKTL